MLKEANKVAESIKEKYLENGDDPTEELAKVAADKGWSPRQIDLVSNNLNTKILSGLHKQAAKDEKDPHFTYPTVDTKEVVKMMKDAGCRPSPSTPKPEDQSKLDKIFPDTDQTNSGDKITTLDTDHLDEGSLDFIARVVNKLKNLVKRKRSKKAQLDQKITHKQTRLEKKASQAIMAGQPADILDHLPVDKDGMCEKLASMNVDVQETDRDIELKEDTELKKIASQIEDLKLQRDEAIVELDEAEEKLDYAKTKMRNKQ